MSSKNYVCGPRKIATLGSGANKIKAMTTHAIRESMNLLYTKDQWEEGERNEVVESKHIAPVQVSWTGPSERICVVCEKRKRTGKRSVLCGSCMSACYCMNDKKCPRRGASEEYMRVWMRRKTIHGIGVTLFNMTAWHLEGKAIGYEQPSYLPLAERRRVLAEKAAAREEAAAK